MSIKIQKLSFSTEKLEFDLSLPPIDLRCCSTKIGTRLCRIRINHIEKESVVIVTNVIHFIHGVPRDWGGHGWRIKEFLCELTR